MKVAIAGDYSLPTTRGMNLDMVITHPRGEVRAKVTGTTASPFSTASRPRPASCATSIPRRRRRASSDLLKRFGR